MTPGITASATAVAGRAKTEPSALARFFSIENRYLPPMLITLILLVGQVSFGLLESFPRTVLAISTSLIVESILSRFVTGKFVNLASAYISGISVGILCRSPEYWPFALCAAISITSKYVIRWRGRHLWNPSNFAICAMLILAPDVFTTLSIQWGNTFWPMMVVWVVGCLITWRVDRIHITGVYVASFVFFALLRGFITGHGFLAEVAPITGPMYQLFIFFMITDPKTTVRTRKGQCLVAFLIAIAEMLLRLAQNIHAPYYALAIVGPMAIATEIWWTSRTKPATLATA
jgi:Na+-translocating ferredoxin:NAD+ oxidoreductase RnfD subunit